MIQDNTVGSRSKIDHAYIAGFLDGDGSLMMQIKKRSDSRFGKRIMLTICFYQDSRHEHPLRWIRSILGIGYISRRNDGMSELRMNGYAQVERVVALLLPYLRFKKKQAQAILSAARLLQRKDRYSETVIRKLVDHIITVQSENYATRKKRSREELLSFFDLTP